MFLSSGACIRAARIIPEAPLARAPGFRRGRNLEKPGMQGQDTSELFFEDVRVPVSNLIGPNEGEGFTQLMVRLPRERLIIAIMAVGFSDCILREHLLT